MSNFNYNKVILGGRLTDTPELKTTGSQIVYTDFTIAVNRRASKQGDAATDFIRCTAWRENAENIVKWFQKGGSICIEGSLQVRQWTDNEGKKRSATDVVVDRWTFVDGKSDGKTEITTSPKFEDVPDDDLPF